MIKQLETLLNEANQAEFHGFISRFQPYDLSNMFIHLDVRDQLKMISKLSIPLGAEILEDVEPELQYRILDRLNKETKSLLLNEMSSDKVVDFLLALHPHQANALMSYLPSDYREKVSNLMTFPDDTAGSLATVDYISARNTWTVDQTLEHVRKVGTDAELITYIYVVDIRGKLTGIVSLKEVILAKTGTKLEDIMKIEVISVSAEMHQEEVASLLSNYDLVAIPVVTVDDRIIGIITVDDLIDVIHEEATEDFQKLGGSQPLEEPYFKNSVWGLFRKRIGWLLILFVAEAYTGNVLRYFEDTLSEVR